MDVALTGTMREVAFFDTAPYCGVSRDDSPSFEGVWSSYPYFEDEFPGQLVIVSNIGTGLFILDVDPVLEDSDNRNVETGIFVPSVPIAEPTEPKDRFGGKQGFEWGFKC